MDRGTLSFSLNGEDFGIAYDDAELKKGPLYATVALLHCSGCTIKGELPIPAIYQGKWYIYMYVYLSIYCYLYIYTKKLYILTYNCNIPKFIK